MQKPLLPIQTVARKLEIPEKYFEPLGSQSGKVKLELLSDPAFKRRGKLIIVTATTPTAAGEGKTVTAISLTQGLAHIGKKAVITSREPSLGPVFGKQDGGGYHTGFVITAASEIMAIVALAKDRKDLRKRLDSIVIGVARDGKPVSARDLGATGGMMALLAEAILPNLAQTTDGTPAFVHAGPFGNIAHGTSSVISQEMGLCLADYVVNECGFASDLGAEKYFDIVMQQSGITPAAAVLVTTVQSMRSQGDGDFERGLSNLGKHIEILKKFGVPTIGAINRFPNDSAADLNRLGAYCVDLGVASALSEGFAKGGPGAKELAEKVVNAIAKNPAPPVHPLYSLEEPLVGKIQRIAHKIYGASDVNFSEQAKAKLRQFTEWGYGKLPVCIAKTQYSLSDDPKRLGAPAGWTLNVTNASLSAGAGFVVVIAGTIILLPALPTISQASSIDVDDSGALIGV